MVNLDKLICSLIDNGSIGFANLLKKALCEQGIEYSDGRLYSIDKKYFKFERGDWVIDDSDKKIYFVWAMTNFEHQYILEEPNGKQISKSIINSERMRPWTLEDAREGDVLTNGKVVFIYKGMTKHNSILADCSTENIDEYQIYDIKNVRPATKCEQYQLSTYIEKELTNH